MADKERLTWKRKRYSEEHSANKKTDFEENVLKNYICCLFQALNGKRETSKLKRDLKTDLGYYAFRIVNCTHVPEHKRHVLLNEVLHALDKDGLSDQQFEDEIMRIRSSDDTRHYLREALGEDESKEIEKSEPTFEDKFDGSEIPVEEVKKDISYLKSWESLSERKNVDKILKKIFNYIKDNESDINIEVETPEIVKYVHVDNPTHERDLFEDLLDIFNGEEERMRYVPIGTILTLLDSVLKSINNADLNKLPSDFKMNLKKFTQPYSMFDNSIVNK